MISLGGPGDLVWRILGILIFVLEIGFSVEATPLPFIKRESFPSSQKSASREFIVYGTQRELVSYIIRRADSLATRWNRLLRLPALSQGPIIIRLLENSSSAYGRRPFKINLYLGDDHSLRVQLDVFDLGEVGDPEFDGSIFHAIALRNAYATLRPTAGSQYHQPPGWVVDAAVQDVLDSEEGDFSRSYAAALVGAQNLDLKTFLIEKPWTMDATSHMIYRVKARALLQSLIELPRGAAGIRAFLSNPAAWDGTVTSLIAYFPKLQGNPNTLAKIWLLNLARPTMVQRALPFPMGETAQRLNAILAISPPDGIKSPKDKIMTGAEMIPLIAAVSKYKYLLRNKAQDLLLLSFRAHPMYRPLIDDYRKIIETFLRYPHKNLDVRIKATEKLQWSLNQRSADIEDYMNCFEAVLFQDTSNPFQSLLENDQRRRAPSWRSDAISRAVDAVEATGW